MSMNIHSRIGIVHINARDIGMLKAFYANGLSLNILYEDDDVVHLGKDDAIIILHASPNLASAKPGDAGLYHVALLYSSRSELAHVVRNILMLYPQHYAGSADHDVSEAFYFNDPENNGLELYFDRPHDDWKWVDERVQMSTKRLDINAYISKHMNGDKDGVVKIGHIHLKIGDVSKAKEFYVNGLGFDITSERDGALFVSTGKYHHNIGLNVWESLDAGVREETLGLRSFEIIMPEIEDIRKRLDDKNIDYIIEDDEIMLSDPWGANIIIRRDKDGIQGNSI